ncbi:MAG: aminotransferase class V-fold PLP-dependent enzyme [Deltaproteobacteria bacterium]|nr:aminotransferase class V-fold PLP-dependent enzyme [Deltaproteobacteria bacterium]
MEFPEDVQDITYLDNAATVFPKPPEVCEGAIELYKRYGVNPGRSGYDLCLVGGDLVQNTRKTLTRFFGGTDPDRLCFAYNASDALNILIQGMVAKGDHVITTTLEHNSVIRPLNHLKRDGLIEVDFVPYSGGGWMDPGEIAARFRKNTSLVVVNHGSNVIGTLQPVEEIGRLCRERGIRFVIDAAQTAGVVPIDVGRMCIDALAFTGHKSLLAPTGIGGMYVAEGVEVRQTRYGGTGVKSAYPYHLEEYPFRLEVGTLNVLGIVGLLKAQEYIEKRGMTAIYTHEMELFARLQEGMQEIDRVTLHGTTSLKNRLPVLSFTVEGLDPSDAGTMLDVDHNVAARTGLQCAPLVHEQMGTAPRGTVRFGLGPMNEEKDVETALEAVRQIAAGS